MYLRTFGSAKIRGELDLANSFSKKFYRYVFERKTQGIGRHRAGSPPYFLGNFCVMIYLCALYGNIRIYIPC
jgi:hypothetical protein